MSSLILTSSFHTVAKELLEKGLLPKHPARVAFVTTAAMVYEQRPWFDAERKKLIELGYDLFDLDLKGKNAEQLKTELEPSEIIFVVGGNTSYLFEHVHASGFDSIIHALLAGGRMYIGSSAGAILAGPTVEPFIEEDLPELPKDFVLHDPKGLGLVDYVILPHYPEHGAANDKVAEKYAGRFKFVKMTDQKYRVEKV